MADDSKRGGDNRKEYVVTINGIDHTMLLNADDAERYGDAAKEAKSTKSRTPSNK